MRILMVHCQELKFEDHRRSNRPEGIVPSRSTAGSYSNVLAAFLCVELGDLPGDLEEAAKIVEAHHRLMRAKGVVLVPFAHLSGDLAHPQAAAEILEKIASLLDNLGILLGRSSFGYHKSMTVMPDLMSLFGHPGSVAFRAIPASREARIARLLGTNPPSEALEIVRPQDSGVGL